MDMNDIKGFTLATLITYLLIRADLYFPESKIEIVMLWIAIAVAVFYIEYACNKIDQWIKKESK